MTKLKITDTGERIGIGDRSIPYSIKVDENTYIGFGYGNPSEKLHVSGKGIPIGPHGEYCGCKWFDDEGNLAQYVGLGCPNPNNHYSIPTH
jgi:hypothetical protein